MSLSKEQAAVISDRRRLWVAVAATMVDSIPRSQGPPSRINGIRPPRLASTCSARVGLIEPLALLIAVETIPDIIRTATNLVPETVQDVRIVDITGLDVQADGGTHVASTKQIGRIKVAKIESKGRGFRRLRIQISS